jgi:hypothetical protein
MPESTSGGQPRSGDTVKRPAAPSLRPCPERSFSRARSAAGGSARKKRRPPAGGIAWTRGSFSSAASAHTATTSPFPIGPFRAYKCCSRTRGQGMLMMGVIPASTVFARARTSRTERPSRRIRGTRRSVLDLRSAAAVRGWTWRNRRPRLAAPPAVGAPRLPHRTRERRAIFPSGGWRYAPDD